MAKKKKSEIIDNINSRLLFKFEKAALDENYKVEAEELIKLLKSVGHTPEYAAKNDEFINKYGILPVTNWKEFESLLGFVRTFEKGTRDNDPSVSCARASSFDSVLPFTHEEPVKLYDSHKSHILIKVDPNTPREIIHFYLDRLLDSIRIENQLKKRFTKEQRDALKVWEARKLRKPFPAIARELNIPVSTAKMRFFKAYEIFYNKKYNPKDYEKPAIKKEYLKRECKTCSDYSSCNVLCPDVLPFAEQDQVSQREYLLETPDIIIRDGRKKIRRKPD